MASAAVLQDLEEGAELLAWERELCRGCSSCVTIVGREDVDDVLPCVGVGPPPYSLGELWAGSQDRDQSYRVVLGEFEPDLAAVEVGVVLAVGGGGVRAVSVVFDRLSEVLAAAFGCEPQFPEALDQRHQVFIDIDRLALVDEWDGGVDLA
ncbi:hypothetical protein EBO15_20235 [Actinomadura harenae]|uniref:Uncharacterized protein n=1 Tax=Actinomadura harenae TaxID=2483351 RepID=A0A3M2LX58_9ACTN|nr:hypothetical protein EBO15_20235 [Actinomadura harenae]